MIAIFQLFFLISIPVTFVAALLYQISVREFRLQLGSLDPVRWSAFLQRNMRSFTGISYRALVETKTGAFDGLVLPTSIQKVRRRAEANLYVGIGAFFILLLSLAMAELLSP